MVDRLNPAGVQPVTGQAVPTAAKPRREAGGPSFAEVLQQQLLQTAEGVKFSAHAVERMRTRDIELTSTDLSRIDEAVKRAASKGSRESLLMSDKGAFVVSVKNRTVITVVDPAHLK